MPLPSDEQILATSQDLIDQLKTLFGKHPGFRPAHAKGHVLNGTFTPSPAASSLSKATHFNTSVPVPVLARFSTSTGLPAIPDTDSHALPHGIGLRFQLPDSPAGLRQHTDIVAHSTPTFPARTGADFLALLRALGAAATETEHPNSIEKHLAANPAAKFHVSNPPPLAASYATETYYSVCAFHLVSAAGKRTNIRYRVIPVAGTAVLTAEEFAAKPAEYLRAELESRIAASPIEFDLVAQVGGADDATNDATKLWPEDREIVVLGRVKLDSLLAEEEGKAEQKKVIFDPIPRIEGVEASDDPLLEMRAAIYLISGRERRAA